MSITVKKAYASFEYIVHMHVLSVLECAGQKRLCTVGTVNDILFAVISVHVHSSAF